MRGARYMAPKRFTYMMLVVALPKWAQDHIVLTTQVEQGWDGGLRRPAPIDSPRMAIKIEWELGHGVGYLFKLPVLELLKAGFKPSTKKLWNDCLHQMKHVYVE